MKLATRLAASTPTVPLLAGTARAGTGGEDAGERQVGRSVFLFLTGFSVFFSTVSSTRLQIGSLRFHPYLLMLGILLLMTGISAFQRLSHRFVRAMVIYVIAFTAFTFQAGPAINEVVKMVFTFLTISAIAVAVRNRHEVRAVAGGLIAAVALVSVQAVLHPTSSVEGFNPISSGNKNSFSLYALPVILIASFFALERITPRRTRLLFAAATVLNIFAVLSTGNRSGYVGLALIIVMLLARGRRPRDAAIIVVVGVLAYLLLTSVGSSSAFLFRLSDPLTSQGSDQLRENIIKETMLIGWEHPLLGVGPQAVDQVVGSRLAFGGDLDAHNLFGYNFAGGGFPLILALGYLAVSVWKRPEGWPPRSQSPPDANGALSLMRMLVLLIAVRGYFTEEVLTIPGFTVAIGIVLGLVLVSGPLGQEWDAELARAAWDPGAPDAPGVPDATVAAPEPGPAARRHPDLFARERERRHAQADRLAPPPRAP